MFELLEVLVARRVDVLGLGDELHLVVAADAAALEGPLVLAQFGAVDDQ